MERCFTAFIRLFLGFFFGGGGHIVNGIGSLISSLADLFLDIGRLLIYVLIL